MIVDSSALIAILTQEPEASAFARALEGAPVNRISAATLLEAGIVVDGKGSPLLANDLDDLIATTQMIIEPFTHDQVVLARRAYLAYGKGSGHDARLNFGDCFAYALAKTMREPLLFKGDDFRQTDIKPAI